MLLKYAESNTFVKIFIMAKEYKRDTIIMAVRIKTAKLSMLRQIAEKQERSINGMVVSLIQKEIEKHLQRFIVITGSEKGHKFKGMILENMDKLVVVDTVGNMYEFKNCKQL
jgi:hypothetical protein